MQLYLSYRSDDASGFALHLTRELGRLAPDVGVVSGEVGTSAGAPAVPPAATVLLLVGKRWLRSAAGSAPHLANAGDPLRRFLESHVKKGTPIVPVLFQLPASQWAQMCAELPKSLGSLAQHNAIELRPASFAGDLTQLLASLRTPARTVPWTEAGARTLIRVESEGGGPLKWWTAHDKVIRVVVDGTEVGALTGFSSAFEAPVEPGRHTVDVRQGLFFKSAPVTVDVSRGATVSLVCGRNGFTGTVSLRKA